MARLLQIIISVAAVLLGLHFLPWQKVLANITHVDPVWFGAALVVAFLSIVTTGLRWIYIARRLTDAPPLTHWRVYLLATFYNSFTPANIGGDVYRVVALRSWTKEHATAGLLAGLVIERLLGLASFLAGYLIALAAVFLTGQTINLSHAGLLVYPAIPVLGGLVMLALLPMAGRLGLMNLARTLPGAWFGRAEAFEAAARMAMKQNLWALIGLSLLAWAAWVGAVALVAQNLHLGLSLPVLAMIVSLTEIIRLIPISFQGIGVREGVFSMLVGLAGGSAATAFVVAAVAYAALSLVLAIAGVLGGTLNLSGLDGGPRTPPQVGSSAGGAP